MVRPKASPAVNDDVTATFEGDDGHVAAVVHGQVS
jgi:hypothetical protein